MFYKGYDRRYAALAVELAFAPAVVLMRLPLLAAESRGEVISGVETALAVREKAEALAEGMAAAQLSMIGSAMRFWPDLLAGRSPAQIVDRAIHLSARAAVKPMGRRVRANYRRLSRG
ncbi:MAG: hypothetical protein F9K19_11510 [Rhizobiaceae bacterium]|nr:MAG: hypothetical protein F9K19_11510 [Rhizobiaceae bacterium]CAG0950282.1 hypothetical protein RHIZO_00150 [Rhizobiaceae bacterium]